MTDNALADALRQAADDLENAVAQVESWGGYVHQYYFQKRHSLPTFVKTFVDAADKARTALKIYEDELKGNENAKR